MSTLLEIDDASELAEICAVPPRSRLYCLEPVGVGTGMVESLTSYIARLAAAHSLKLSTFVIKILAPMSTRKGAAGISGRHDLLPHLGVRRGSGAPDSKFSR